MTAAYYLRKQGHDVTIKEALPSVGGMMAYGIPAYRLPRTIILEEAKVITDQGVKIERNEKVENRQIYVRIMTQCLWQSEDTKVYGYQWRAAVWKA